MPEAVRGVAIGSVGANRRPLAGSRDDGLPADAAGEGAVVELNPVGVLRRRPQLQLDASGLQPAGARWEAELRGPGGAELRAPPVDRQHEPPGDLVLLALEDLGAAEVSLLHGGDLRLVEDVA